MSDEEEDAVPLGDEFAVMLSRRTTNQGSTEDQSSGKTRAPSSKRPAPSRRSTRTVSSKSLKSPSTKSQRSASQKSLAPISPTPVTEHPEPPTMLDFNNQEEEVEREEELEIKQKRDAVHRLVMERGLRSRDTKSLATEEVKPDSPAERDQDGFARAETSTPERDPSLPADLTSIKRQDAN